VKISCLNIVGTGGLLFLSGTKEFCPRTLVVVDGSHTKPNQGHQFVPGWWGKLIDHVHQGLQFWDGRVVQPTIVASNDLPLGKYASPVLSKPDDLADLCGCEGGQMDSHGLAPLGLNLEVEASSPTIKR
jgi:hypothetical protein